MQRALVLDPATGDFRAPAEQLQDKAGKLDARPRTVAEHATFLTVERSP
ncbi:hypothetical protein [Streptomyces sp. NPDC093260]